MPFTIPTASAHSLRGAVHDPHYVLQIRGDGGAGADDRQDRGQAIDRARPGGFPATRNIRIGGQRALTVTTSHARHLAGKVE